LFEGGFEVFDDLLSENVGIRKIVGLFEAFVSELQDVEASFVAVDKSLIIMSTVTRCKRLPARLICPNLIRRGVLFRDFKKSKRAPMISFFAGGTSRSKTRPQAARVKSKKSA